MTDISFLPGRLEVEAASGQKFIFHKFLIRNSGVSSGDVRKKCVYNGQAGVDNILADWTQGNCYNNNKRDIQ